MIHHHGASLSDQQTADLLRRAGCCIYTYTREQYDLTSGGIAQAHPLFGVWEGNMTNNSCAIFPLAGGLWKYSRTLWIVPFSSVIKLTHSLSSDYEWIPFRAHAAVPAQHMPCELWNENMGKYECLVGMWEIQWRCILRKYMYLIKIYICTLLHEFTRNVPSYCMSGRGTLTSQRRVKCSPRLRYAF